MANPLLTSALDLSAYTESGVWQKNIKTGILSQLSPSDPEIKVGATDIFTFTGTPKAELVGEGANKASTDGTPTKVTANTYKVQMTYRYSEEVKYADEDYQLGLVNALVGNIAKGLSRAVDLVAIHGINPNTGSVSSNVTSYFTKDVASVTDSGSALTDLESMASALQTNGYNASAIALDPVYAGTLARTKDSDGRPLFPELGLGFNVNNVLGLSAAVSNTVSGSAEMTSATTEAIIGDFSAFKWGIAREIPLQVIEYGDPDGAGDLKRNNEIAIRAEIIFGFAILDPKAFSILAKASA